MKKIELKTKDDFNGYWVRNIKIFKGHEGEPLVQCSVYKDDKRIGFFSDDSWGGPALFQGFEEKDLYDLKRTAKKITNSNVIPEHIFVNDIVNEILFQRDLKKKCKNKILLKTKDNKEDEFTTLLTKGITPERSKLISDLDKRFGKNNYQLINDLFN